MHDVSMADQMEVVEEMRRSLREIGNARKLHEY
jgi:hypothetical protein